MRKKIIQSIISIILIFIFIGADWTVVLAAIDASSITLNSTGVNLTVNNNANINRNGLQKYISTYSNNFSVIYYK